MSNLEELAVRAGKGDRDAFEGLVRRAHAQVWRYAYHLTRSRELADEAAQETWIRSIRALPRFRGESTVMTWLLTIVRRVVADLLERARRREVATPPVAPPPGTGYVELQLALAALPHPLHETLVLTQVLGMTYAETAAITGAKVGTVRSRVFRARSALVELLRDGGAATAPSRQDPGDGALPPVGTEGVGEDGL